MSQVENVSQNILEVKNLSQSEEIPKSFGLLTVSGVNRIQVENG
jgi:hypothetical protein